VVALGVGLRVRQWWYGRAFWLDELLLIRAMSEQKIGEVLTPLNLAQSAPPGWLAVEHVLIGLAPGERGARLLPLLFGVGALVLTALLARTLLGGPAALVATAIAAFSTRLIQYSSELKQYSADGFWLQLVLLLGVRLALRRGTPARDRYVFAAVAAVAVWFSHATAIAIGGIFLVLGVQALAGRRWRELLVLVGCAVPFAAGFGIEYATLLSANAANPALTAYWASAFPPDGPLSWGIGWDWVLGRSRSVVSDPLHWAYTWPLLVLLLGGLTVLGVRRPRALPLLVVPVLALGAAGLAGAYPIANRLALWLVPLVAIAVAAPLDLVELAARLRRPARRVAVAVAAVLALAAAGQLVSMVAPAVGTDARYLATPYKHEESRSAVRLVAEQRRPGDLVLVDWGGARFAVEYYAPKVGLGSYRILRARVPSSACAPTWFGTLLRRAPGIERVWLLWAHTDGRARQMYIDHLSPFGPPAERVSFTGAGAIRFDRAAAAPTPPAGRPRWCLQLQAPNASP
jgi:hypothetical protein